MTPASVITVGTFDGVHRGHREVIRTLLDIAGRRHMHPVVVTFDRHPLEVVAPDRAPKLIVTLEERDRLLAQEGVEVVILPFDSEVRKMTAAEWMRTLRDRFGMKVLVLGYDNSFGSDGHSLSVDDFKRIGEGLGIAVVEAGALPGCSSSAVRKAVADGDVARAAEILGRPFSMSAIVVHGRQIGRTIGFPTANIEVPPAGLIPKAGVYAATVTLPNGKSRPAVVNIGDNPTVSGDGRIRIEAHIPEFDGDLYGKKLSIAFIRRIRGERKFDSLSDLQTQIQRDIAELSAPSV